jgi:hypothetical protein
MAEFLRSTGPESFLGGTTTQRRGSLPTDKKTPYANSVRSLPSTPVTKHRKTIAPPVPSPKPVAREPAGTDPEHSTLQLAAFLRTTGPNEPPVAPITLGSRKPPKATASSIHSTDTSTVGLLKYQSPQSSRFPPSPSTSTAYGTFIDDDDDEEDLELSMYPGARRKQKSAPQEESLAEFLRSTAMSPEPNLPPSPQTPKAVRDNFGAGLLKKMSRGNIKSPEPVVPKAMDIFAAANLPAPKLSPSGGIDTQGGWQIGGSSRPALQSEKSSGSLNRHHLSVNVPSLHYNESSRSNGISQNRAAGDDDIRVIRKVPSRSLIDGAGPREAVQKRSATTDSLAEFLKNTGPTDFGGVGSDPPKAIKKSKSGFFKRLLGNNGAQSNGIQRSGSTSGRFTPITIPAEAR